MSDLQKTTTGVSLDTFKSNDSLNQQHPVKRIAAMTVKETDKNTIGKGKAGPGRPKGSANKTTLLVKDAVIEAASKAHPEGMVGYLVQQAIEHPTAFLPILGRIIPTQIETGPEGITIKLPTGAANL